MKLGMGSFEAGKRLISTADVALPNRKRGLTSTAKETYLKCIGTSFAVHWNVIYDG